MNARRIVLAVSLVLATSLLYAPAHTAPFQFDDAIFLRDDNVRLGRIGAFFFPPVPRILAWTTFAAQFRLHGEDAGSFRWFNIILHSLNSAAVFALLLLSWRFFPAFSNTSPRVLTLSALLAAFLFAVHPIQSEATMYIYQRSTLMAAGFSFLSIIASLKEKEKWCLLAFLLAVLSKETALILPVIFWFSSGVLKSSWRPSKTVLLTGTLSLLLGTAYLFHLNLVADGTVGLEAAGWLTYLATQIKVFWIYVLVAIAGQPLNLDWQISAVNNLLDPSFLLASGGLVILGTLLKCLWRFPCFVYWIGIFLLFLLPSSSIVPSQDFMSEHRTYGAMLGWCGLLMVAVARLLTRQDLRRGLWFRALLVLFVLAFFFHYAQQTETRIVQWRTPTELWQDAVEKSPTKYRTNLNLGILLMDHHPEEAVSYLTRAIDLNPNLPQAYRTLGEVLFVSGNLAQAETLWRKALSLEPGHAETHLALAKLYLRKKDYFATQTHLSTVRKLLPRDWTPYWYGAQLHLLFGLREEAILLCEEGLERQQGQMDLRWLLVECMLRVKNENRAVELARQNLQLRSTSDDFYRMARVLSRVGQNSEAMAAVKDGLSSAEIPSEALRGKSFLAMLERETTSGKLAESDDYYVE